jgi:hypothetical protein
MVHSGTMAAEDVRVIHGLGPNHVLTMNFLKRLKCSMSVDFTFTAGACSDEFCGNVDMGAKAISVATAIKTLGAVTHVMRKPLRGKLGMGARIIRDASPRRSFFSAVGIAPLLPLFHPCMLQRGPKSLALAADLLRVSLEGYAPSFEEFARLDGATVISDLLLRAPCNAINDAALNSFMELGNCLASCPMTRARAHSLLELNFSCWHIAVMDMQHKLAASALALVSSMPEFYLDVLGIPAVFQALRGYTLLTASSASSAEDVPVIRSLLCKIIETLMCTAADKITKDDVGALVNYMRECKEPDLIDVSQLCIAALTVNPNKGFVNVLDSQFGGIKSFFRLLSARDKRLRLYGIQIVGLYIITQSNKDSRSYVTKETMHKFAADFPFDQLRELLEPNALDEETYMCLAQLFAQDYGYKGHRPRKLAKIVASGKKTFPNVEALGVIFDLLSTELGRASTAALPGTLKLVEDLAMAIEVSPALQETIISQGLWQRWLVSLILHLETVRTTVDVHSDKEVV